MSPLSSPPQAFAHQTVLAEYLWIAYGESYDEKLSGLGLDPATPVWLVAIFGDLQYTLHGFPYADDVYPVYENMIFVIDAFSGRGITRTHYVPGCDPANFETRDCGTPDIGYIGPTKVILDFIRDG